uniref:Uncharacterized protein n=1 Tax=Panagrolaimus sp. JU765 TaxID=591449 RepID=A0AC34QTL5_9BILA
MKCSMLIMLFLRALVILFLVIAVSDAVKFIDQISRQGSQLLLESRNGKSIRQCSCGEQDICVKEIQAQIDECFDTCWNNVEKVAHDPKALKHCFKQKQYIIDNLVTCVEDNLETCVSTKNGKEIPYTDISKFLTKGEKKLQTQVRNFMLTIGESAKVILETALKVGTCMKECFLRKNSEGFCFDRVGCQPLIEAKSAGRSLKKCIKNISWKKEASDVCQCMVKSGVVEMDQYCQMLRTMGGGH